MPGDCACFFRNCRETGGDTFLFGDTGQSDHFLAIFGGTGGILPVELPEGKRLRGTVLIQFGFPFLRSA